MDAKSIIGRYVRQLREGKGLTQDQLARKTGISYQFLSGLENGLANFSIDVLESLSQALGVRVDKLVAEAFGSSKSLSAPLLEKRHVRQQAPRHSRGRA